MPDEVKIVIEYEKIIAHISAEIKHIWQELATSEETGVKELISQIKCIEVSDEQHFRKEESNNNLCRGTVYLVVRFSPGSINYASSVTPVSIYSLGVANQVKPVQLLLGTFASYWTTKNLSQDLTDEAEEMLQVWNTPEVVSNFNISGNEFRNLYRVTGNIVIGPKAVRVGTLSYHWNKNSNTSADWETINVMAFHDDYRASMDPQPFGNTFGFAESETNFSTYAFSISTYLLDNHLTADMLAIRGFRQSRNPNTTGALTSEFDPNDKMEIKLKFTNGFANHLSGSSNLARTNFFGKFKVAASGIGQEIAGIPTLTITFTR